MRFAVVSTILVVLGGGCGFDATGQGLAETLGGSATTGTDTTPVDESSGPPDSGSTTTTTGTSSGTSTTTGAATTATDGPDTSAGSDASTGDGVDCGDAEPWALGGWSRRVPVTIDTTTLTTPRADMPIVLRLRQEDIDYDQVAAEGADIRIVASGTGALLPYEIERWTLDRPSFVWFKVPSLPASSSLRVWLYFGNPSARDVSNRAEVWSDGFESVHHFEDFDDSTEHGHDGDSSNPPGFAAGRVGRAGEFDGSNDHLNVPGEPDFDFTTEFSVEAWILTPAWNNPWAAIVAKGNDTWRLQRDDVGEIMSFDLDGDATGTAGHLNGATDVADDAWHYLVAVYGDETQSIYVDGQQDSSQAFAGPIVPNDREVRIGDNGQLSNTEFEGRIDEVRISTVARDAEWIAFQNAVMTFQAVNLGPEQTCP